VYVDEHLAQVLQDSSSADADANAWWLSTEATAFDAWLHSQVWSNKDNFSAL
jgi:hypothetical protein